MITRGLMCQRVICLGYGPIGFVGVWIELVKRGTKNVEGICYSDAMYA